MKNAMVVAIVSSTGSPVEDSVSLNSGHRRRGGGDLAKGKCSIIIVSFPPQFSVNMSRV